MSTSLYRPVVMSILREQGARTILDAPCGSGWLGEAVQRSGMEIDALDGMGLWEFPDPSLPYSRVGEYDLDRPMPESDRQYDAVVCGEAIHLVTNPGVVFESFRRALRPGGIAIITTPNIWYPRSRLQFMLRGFHSGFRPAIGKERGRDYITYFPWTYAQLHQFFTHYGYEDVRLHEVDEPKPKRFGERLLGLPTELYFAQRRRRAAGPQEAAYWETAASRQSIYGRWLVVSGRKPAG